jgi:aminoglycoside phosphotransferase (APT) family kinase protein
MGRYAPLVPRPLPCPAQFPPAMTEPWKAEIEIDEDLVRCELARLRPELREARIERLGDGWDASAWLVDSEWVVRFPRRAMGRDAVENEIHVTPLLAPHLDIPIPVPEWIGSQSETYPYRFVGHRMIPGATGCSLAADDAARGGLAEHLGHALRTLHTIRLETQREADAPLDTLKRANMSRRHGLMRSAIDAMETQRAELALDDVLARAGELCETPPWQGSPVWVHGDLYARHLALAPDGSLAGIIDWGDCHRGDPALDLSLAISFLPSAARGAFRSAYGPIDAHTWSRAHFGALHYGVHLTRFGDATQDAAMSQTGRIALAHAMSSED